MDESTPDTAPRSDDSRPDFGPARPQRPGLPFLGALIVPILIFLLSQARIGPPGYLWREGGKMENGGETILTPLGQIIFTIGIMGGGIVGFLCGSVLDSLVRPVPPDRD
jgi:hypothetical protein